MRKYYYAAQIVASGIIAWFSDKLGILLPIIAILFGLMVVDYITGMLASKKEAVEHPGDSDYGWSSKKGSIGIIKKVGYVCMIAVAMSLDWTIMIAAEQLGQQLPGRAFFGLLVAVWYLLNETLSICENCGRMGAPVPEWMLRYIAVLKNKIDDSGSGAAEGSDPAISLAGALSGT